MKTKLIFLFAIMIYGNINAQIVENIISTNQLGPGSIFTADFNNDGDMDVLSASTNGHHIDWWENDGNEIFTRHLIQHSILRPYQIYAADVNGDGDLDVLSVSRDDDKLAWYENLGGGDFGDPGTNQILITAQANTDGARFLDFADLDGDNLKDVISASHVDGKIAWYKNLGNGDFGDINTNQNIISNEEIGAIAVHAVDIDGDDDMDVVAASSSWMEGINEIVWFENSGNGIFSIRKMVHVAFDDYTSVSSADFDGNGTMDLVSSSFSDGIIAWHKNINGDGSVWETIIVTDDADGAVFVYPTDYDDDGDFEFLAASAFDNRIVLYVFNGTDNFFEAFKFPISTADFPVSVHAADVNGDGSLNILSASVDDNKIAWYEYILGVNDNLLLDFSVYPSPTKGILNIQSKTAISQIEVYNQLGQVVISNYNKNLIDISSVSQGIYFIKIKDENGAFGTQKVVKK